MINISITKKNGYITNVSISGHANTAKYGSDIV
ncbi:MAG: ribosomal-processing cysteine protease Prp, partial [Peptostreptococcaceae bacterium]|nr:ribosomal-processing cysteine protease Prp [Peptostreptococcaceae bacterium]